MHVCNKTSNSVTVAMATLGDMGFETHVWGWWSIEPDACGHYYYAYDSLGSI